MNIPKTFQIKLQGLNKAYILYQVSIFFLYNVPFKEQFELHEK